MQRDTFAATMNSEDLELRQTGPGESSRLGLHNMHKNVQQEIAAGVTLKKVYKEANNM